MKSNALLSSLALVATMAFTGFSAEPLKVDFPAPSPTGSLKQRVGFTDIEIVYSRPSAKGRKVIGGLVPFGQVWRTGANASTKVSFSTSVRLEGAEVPAGKYAIYTIPGEKEWTVIIYKDINLAAVSGYNQSNDVVRVKVKPAKLSQSVESFTMEINDLRDDSATLNLMWENTRVPVKIQLDLVPALVPQIESLMSAPGDKKPYYQAAMFYFDHNQDLAKTRQWIEAAVAGNETYYTVHLKAKVLAKLGDKAGATAAAKRSTELAIKAEGPNTGYVKMNKDVIASVR